VGWAQEVVLPPAQSLQGPDVRPLAEVRRSLLSVPGRQSMARAVLRKGSAKYIVRRNQAVTRRFQQRRSASQTGQEPWQK
jgi:hypothetical protein